MSCSSVVALLLVDSTVYLLTSPSFSYPAIAVLITAACCALNGLASVLITNAIFHGGFTGFFQCAHALATIGSL